MSVAEEIERLQALRDRGALTETEFTQAKARTLSGAGSAAEPGQAAAPGAPAAPVREALLRRLTRSTTDHVIGGVCGGLGAHTSLPSWAWRVIFCVAVLYFGIGLLLYLLLWIFIPATPEQK
jgi:phage shock protein PspC (stress-responsive transcriptional regulator)